jgi:hypothetical protein
LRVCQSIFNLQNCFDGMSTQVRIGEDGAAHTRAIDATHVIELTGESECLRVCERDRVPFAVRNCCRTQ